MSAARRIRFKPGVKERTSMLGEVGDPGAPPGSRPWAIALKQQIRSEYKDRESAAEHLGIRVSLFLRYEGWKVLEDRKGRVFRSWEEFCRAAPPFGLGVEPAAVAVEVERRAELRDGPGRPRKGEEKVANSDNYSGQNTTTAYTLARLDRDNPELAEEVRSGALSANAAAIKAGFRRKTITVPLDVELAAAAIMRHFDADQLDRLAALFKLARGAA